MSGVDGGVSLSPKPKSPPWKASAAAPPSGSSSGSFMEDFSGCTAEQVAKWESEGYRFDLRARSVQFVAEWPWVCMYACKGS